MNTDPHFLYSAVIFAIVLLVGTPIMVNMLVPEWDGDGPDTVMQDVMGDYFNFTGSSTAITQEDPWILSGIYTPYLGGAYRTEPNGWIYGAQVGTSDGYLPSQFQGTEFRNNSVLYDADSNCYRYTSDTYDGHSAGDVYSAVVMSVNQKSDIFFTSAGKHSTSGYFWYDYSGYRYEFMPRSEYQVIDATGDLVSVNPAKSGFSVIWYDYYGNDGLSGQLIISGGDGAGDQGVAYLTAQDVIRGFDTITSTAKFPMVFNGVQMNLYIRILPSMTSVYTLQECWDRGYWELMVTSNSARTSTYLQPDYSFNVYEIFDTFVDLFTFNTSDYGFSGSMGTVASLLMCVPMYALLLAIGFSSWPVLLVAGAILAIQAVATAVVNWDWGGWFSGIDWPWE